MSEPVDKVKKTISDTMEEAKNIVKIAGESLGNLINEIYTGNIINNNWTEEEQLSVNNKVKETKYYILGGSIGSKGYTGEIIPLHAKKKLFELGNTKIEILPSGLDSFNAASLGASFAFNNSKVINSIEEQAKKIISNNKIPIIPLLDIGGTKINFVLAYFDIEGHIINKNIESHNFPTPVTTEPQQFYKDILSNLIPILNKYNESNCEIIKIIGIGQPGRFDRPQGKIISGAKDICGGNLLFKKCKTTPYDLIKDASEDKSFEFYFCNDGIAQFFGLIKNIQFENEKEWEKLNGNKIMYLGIGTGLGIGFGTVTDNELKINEEVRDANGIKINKKFKTELFKNNLLKELYGNYEELEYGQLISSKHFNNYMNKLESNNLSHVRETKDPKNYYFLNYTGISTNKIKDGDVEYLSNFLKLDIFKNKISPLNAKLINEILKDEIVTSKTEIEFDIKKDTVTKELKKSLDIFKKEIEGTLTKNIESSNYVEVINEVINTKKRGKTTRFIGIGKSHIIGKNLSYIYNNLGISSSFVELTGANSENLTTVNRDDLVFFISNSGDTWELLNLLPSIKEKGSVTVALCGRKESYLGKHCDLFINTHAEEDNPLDIRDAPTTTTTLTLVAGTAIAITSFYSFDYDNKSFFLDHPQLKFELKLKKEEIKEKNGKREDYFDFYNNGFKADPIFNPKAKIRQVYRDFAALIAKQGDTESTNSLGKEFYNQLFTLAKRILVSHYNNRSVFITGTGASYKVAEKISATLTSLKIDAIAVNSAQLPHGDFGHINKGDLLIVISYSGNSHQLSEICNTAKSLSASIALITSARNTIKDPEKYPALVKLLLDKNSKEKLYKDSIIVDIIKSDDRKLVPLPDQKIDSSCVNLVVGDLLAIILVQVLNLSEDKFAEETHQGGAIGRKEQVNNEELINKQGDISNYTFDYFSQTGHDKIKKGNFKDLCFVDENFDKNKCKNCINKYLKCDIHKEAISLLKKHLEQFIKNKETFKKEKIDEFEEVVNYSLEYDALLKIFAEELKNFNDKYNNAQKITNDVVIIGAGGVGLTYLGRLLHEHHKVLHFFDSDSRRIKNLKNNFYSYSLQSKENEEININKFSATNSNEIDQIANLALVNDLIFISIGADKHRNLIPTIVYIVMRRYAYRIDKPINFVFCENFEVEMNPLADLRYQILECFDSQDMKVYFDEKVGLVPAVEEVLAKNIEHECNFILPLIVEYAEMPLTLEKNKNDDNIDNVKKKELAAPLYVSMEDWKFSTSKNDSDFKITQKNHTGIQIDIVENKFEIEKDQIEKEIGFKMVDDFYAYHMRKLWVHNMAHFLIGLCGLERGITSIDKTISELEKEGKDRENGKSIISEAMDSISEIIYKRWEFDEHPTPTDYQEWLLRKYKNEYLGDTVARITRDIPRKLGKNERLIGPLNYIHKYGDSSNGNCNELIRGVCLAMQFEAKRLTEENNQEWIKNYQTIRNDVKERLEFSIELLADIEKSEFEIFLDKENEETRLCTN